MNNTVYMVVGAILVLILIIDFAWVIRTALSVH
jgi:hypothetical protein